MGSQDLPYQLQQAILHGHVWDAPGGTDTSYVPVLKALDALTEPSQAAHPAHYKVCWSVDTVDDELRVSVRVFVALPPHRETEAQKDRLEHMRAVVDFVGLFSHERITALSFKQFFALLDRRPAVHADTSTLVRPRLNHIELKPHQKQSLQ